MSRSISIEQAGASTLQAIVARQPICDRYQQTFAYGVLFREFDTENCVFASDDEATSRVGFNSIIRALSSMVMLSSLDDKPLELLKTSVIRARMCQIPGEGTSRHYGSNFTTGLFSTLEAYLDCSMEKAVEPLPLSDEIRNALLHKKGPKGRLLAAVIAYEQGDWDALIQMRIDPEKIAKAYLDSVAWGEELLH